MNPKPFKVTIDPPEYDVSTFVPDPSWSQTTGESRQDFYLPYDPFPAIYPDEPDFATFKGSLLVDLPPAVNMNIPHKVTIEVEHKNLDQFSWRKVQIPVAIAVAFGQSMIEKGILMSFSDRAAKRDAHKTAPVIIEAWEYAWNPTCLDWEDKDSPYQRQLDERQFGQSDYWNMTYFVALPKCSMSYDFWVTVRGVESAHKPFDIEFYVDGRKITRDNFEEMAEKYPALKENKPDPWPLPSLF